jgi:hypothetical protein
VSASASSLSSGSSEQRGLADARRSLQQHDATLPSQSARERSLDLVKLTVALDQ